jgi:hypothetical protein
MSAKRVRPDKRRFPVGASLTRQPLQPEATGAVMEVTKWLKPSVQLVTYKVTAQVSGRKRVTAEQSSKGRCAGRPDNFIGKVVTAG